VKGRSKKYGRYWCRKSGCRAVKLSSEQLESKFLNFLERLRVDPGIASIFPKVAAKVWARKQGDWERELKRLCARLEEKKGLKKKLLRAKLIGEIRQQDYEQANAEFDEEIGIIEEQIRALRGEGSTMEAFVQFAELSLMDVGGAWRIAAPENRVRVQNLLFEEGLDYSPELGILNRSNTSLFSMLEVIKDESSLLASPTGFEPVLSP
jgi:hypothetical protein